MKGFLKFCIGVIIVAGVFFAIYCVLPEKSQTFIKGNIQYRIDEDAATQIDRIQNMSVKGYDVSYGYALTKLCKSTVWYYEQVDTTTWKVTFMGTKASVDLTTEGFDNTYLNVDLVIVFTVRNESQVDITMTIKDETITDSDKKEAMYKKIATAS